MSYINSNIQVFKKKLRTVRNSEELNSKLDTFLADMKSYDWNSPSTNDEMKKLLDSIKDHKLFDANTISLLVKYLPNINNQVYNQRIISDFIASLTTSSFISEKEIRMIYKKFGKSVTVAKALAGCSNTPKDVLEKLAFHEQYSVVAEIANNTGRDAIELLKDPKMAQRVLLAEILINGYTRHIKN